MMELNVMETCAIVDLLYSHTHKMNSLISSLNFHVSIFGMHWVVVVVVERGFVVTIPCRHIFKYIWSNSKVLRKDTASTWANNVFFCCTYILCCVKQVSLHFCSFIRMMENLCFAPGKQWYFLTSTKRIVIKKKGCFLWNEKLRYNFLLLLFLNF